MVNEVVCIIKMFKIVCVYLCDVYLLFVVMCEVVFEFLIVVVCEGVLYKDVVKSVIFFGDFGVCDKGCCGVVWVFFGVFCFNFLFLVGLFDLVVIVRIEFWYLDTTFEREV